MRMVVTGAKGFIGSVLSCRAAELGHEVLALDNESRGLNDVEIVKNVRYQRHDCMSGIGEAMPAEWTHVDAVVHLAAGTGSLDRPIEELRALNVEMTKRVYQDAKAFDARAFVFPTTSLAIAVPDSPYVKSKEEAMSWLLQGDDKKILIPLRFFNVTGAYKDFTEKRWNEVHIVPRLVECFRKGETFVINGGDYWDAPFPGRRDGTPARDFVNVLDVVEYIFWLIAAHLSGVPVRRHIDGATWVGTGRPVTALGVMNIFEQFVGPVHHEIGPRRPYDTGVLCCPPPMVEQLSQIRPITPAWVGIRDEALSLLEFEGEMRA